jgi:hypothetical protein
MRNSDSPLRPGLARCPLALEPELNTRWLKVTQRVLAIQHCLQQQLAEAGAKLQGMN